MLGGVPPAFFVSQISSQTFSSKIFLQGTKIFSLSLRDGAFALSKNYTHTDLLNLQHEFLNYIYELNYNNNEKKNARSVMK